MAERFYRIMSSREAQMNNSNKMRVGFAGLGRMGRGMAHRILGEGHDFAVFDVIREQTAEFVAAGARAASSIADLCTGRDVVVTMLVDDATVIDVVTAKGGMRDSLAAGAIHLAMGTYGVQAIRSLAKAHADVKQILVAAPVLGRPDLAASGQLGIVPAPPRPSKDAHLCCKSWADVYFPQERLRKQQRQSSWPTTAFLAPP
jgi:3-hydroxyisobutyrate dehydrogenase-like beta-hydroxyacid dehydrogenase